ncbi:MAG TPA: nuclear transport factor 2 family protein [Bryobacteraceae bacterium]|nr:nuclear transport factor 2 family protein [Bryobacteraceae bacterium]
MAPTNKQIMENIFAELARGESKLFVESMADDFRWNLAGVTRWSQSFEGKQAVLTELFGMLSSTIEGPIVTRALRFIADGDYVAVEAQGQSTTKTGIPYNNRYCFVFRLAGGKLREVTEYMDTELATAAMGG